jgi:hypothetical protein
MITSTRVSMSPARMEWSGCLGRIASPVTGNHLTEPGLPHMTPRECGNAFMMADAGVARRHSASAASLPRPVHPTARAAMSAWAAVASRSSSSTSSTGLWSTARSKSAAPGTTVAGAVKRAHSAVAPEDEPMAVT